MCHSGLWAARQDAIARGDEREAVALATRIAALPSRSADDTAIKASLLIEIEDPASMPPHMLVRLLLFGIERDLRAIAAGVLPAHD